VIAMPSTSKAAARRRHKKARLGDGRSLTSYRGLEAEHLPQFPEVGGRYRRACPSLWNHHFAGRFPACPILGGAINASEKNLQELFHDTLKDIYFAEKKIPVALPKMAKAAQSKDLKAAFQKHETETEEHVARLEKVFRGNRRAPRGKTCDAIMGIIEEGQKSNEGIQRRHPPSMRPPCGAQAVVALRDRPLRGR